MELKQRLHDLEGEGKVELPKPKGEKTPLQVAVSALNRAAQRKSLLQEHLSTEYGMTLTGNETMATLQQKGMTQILNHVATSGSDKMGFGKYASETYLQVWTNDRAYCRWAHTTAKEGESSIHLRRFVRWVDSYQYLQPKSAIVIKKEMLEHHDPEQPPKMITEKTETPNKGYAKAKAAPKAEPGNTGPNAASSSATSEAMLVQLTQVVANLAKEVEALKEAQTDMPRKVAAKTEGTSNIPKDRA